jgi:predicted RNA-binding Zn-ribbon protein involved in translation (DUF1610 family)
MQPIPPETIHSDRHTANVPCPNCGQRIIAQLSRERLSCPNCNEILVWSDDGRKLLLEKPLSNYLTQEDDQAQYENLWNQAHKSEEIIDIRRRQATVELAAQWVRERMASGKHALAIGTRILFLCAIFSSIAGILFISRGYIHIDTFLLVIITALFAPLGFFFLIWPLVERVSLDKYTARIHDERRMLEEQESLLLY